MKKGEKVTRLSQEEKEVNFLPKNVAVYVRKR